MRLYTRTSKNTGVSVGPLGLLLIGLLFLGFWALVLFWPLAVFQGVPPLAIGLEVLWLVLLAAAQVVHYRQRGVR